MPKCSKCGGTGLIPFHGRKDAFIHCSCHTVYGDNPEPEIYHQASPTDIDYPCSDTFRAYSYQYCNQPDPGYIPQEQEAPAPRVEVITRYKYVDPRANKKSNYKDISA